MGTWDKVETDFGSDETGNFGPRQESGSALYQVDTIATISQREETAKSIRPHLSSALLGELACLAAGNHLSIFKDFQFAQTLEFDYTIDAVAWSPDGACLVVADCNGSIFVVDANSLDIVWKSALLPTREDGQQVVQKILVQKTEDGCYDIVILSIIGPMFVIRGAGPTVFLEDSGNIMERLNVQMVNTSQVHTDQICDVLYLGEDIITLGCGDAIVGVWSSTDGRLELVDEAPSILDGDAGITSGRVTSNGKFLLLLDEKNRLLVWDVKTLTLKHVWEDISVGSFLLLETNDNNNNSLQDVKLVLLTVDTERKCTLLVKSLPSWETCYTLELFPTVLSDCPANQESLYVIEWCDPEQSLDIKEPKLRFRCLTETDPESRLIRLLNKNQFDEAKAFAEHFHLDVELVHKKKSNYLLDQLSPWNVGKYDSETVQNMLSELNTCMTAIKDDVHIAGNFTSVALPTLSDTHKILSYIKKRLQASPASQKESDGRRLIYLNKVMEMSHRLTTYKLVFGQEDYSAEKWESFMRCNLMEEAFHWMKRGDVGKSLGIWSRHQREWLRKLDPRIIRQMLSVIPDSVTAGQLVGWLTDDFIPFILNNIPEALVSVLNWIIRKTLNMELLEKESWPLNAVQFLKSVYQSSISATDVSTIPQETTPAETAIKTKVNVLSAVQSVHTQIVKLEHLYNLQTKYKFHLTYNQFEQETTESVTFRMLDKVVAIELIGPALKKQIRPYMIEHNLKEDEIFSKYIKDLLERTGRVMSYRGEAPWESKALALINYISDLQQKCDAVLEVMKYSSLPWSEEINKLVQTSLQIDHPKVKLLKDQCTLTEIKEILLKYELKNFNVKVIAAADFTRLLYYILTKDLKSSVDDALQTVKLKGMGFCYQLDIYTFRLRHLVTKNRISEAISLVHKLPVYTATVCCKHLVNYASVTFNEPIRFQPEEEKQQRQQFGSAGVAFCSYLTDLLTDYLEIQKFRTLKQQFVSLLALQTEFDEVVVLTDYEKQSYRENLMKKHLHKVFVAKEQQKTNNYVQVFRLAEVLQIPRAHLQGQLALYAARTRQVDTAINLCNDLFTEPSEELGVTLYEVTISLNELQASISRNENASMGLLCKLPDIMHKLASQALCICSPDLLEKCLELTKCTSLCKAVSRQCESGEYSVSVGTGDVMNQDPYKVWRLDPMFREDALVLNSATTLPMCSVFTRSHMNLTESCGRLVPSPGEENEVEEERRGGKNSGLMSLTEFFTSTRKLLEILQENSHIAVSVQYLLHMISASIQFVLQQDMGFPLHDQGLINRIKAQRDTLLQMYPRNLAMLRDLTSTLLSKVFNYQHVDQRRALSYMTCLPKQLALTRLKKIIKTTGHNYKTLIAVAQVGIAISYLTRDTNAMTACQQLESNAIWGHKLSKFKINFKEAFQAASNEKAKLLPIMAQCEAVDILLIKDFCSTFKIEEDEGLLIFLDHLLLQPPPPTVDPDTLRQQDQRLHRAQAAIHDIQAKDMLLERLNNVLEQANSYDYELIQFLLEEINNLTTEYSLTTDKGLKLLNYLKVYRRCAAPGEIEIKSSLSQEKEELGGGVGCLHPLSRERLPYHILISAQPWKIIRPELNSETVTQWITIANLLKGMILEFQDLFSLVRTGNFSSRYHSTKIINTLIQLSPDQVYMTAIQNTVHEYLETGSSRRVGSAAQDKSLCNWELTESGLTLLRKLQEMLVHVSCCEMSMACCTASLVKDLPMGAEKVLALQQCVNHAERWYQAAPDKSADKDKAKMAYVKFSEFHRRLSTEQVLYQNGVAEPDLLKLAMKPEKLIRKLYQHPSILLHDGETDTPKPDIHKIAEKVAGIHSVQLEKIVECLIKEWLPSSGAKEDTDDATMTFNLANLNMMEMELSQTEGDDVSLRRVIYLLSSRSIETGCLFILSYVTDHKVDDLSMTNLCRVRAIRCLLELTDDATIQNITAKPASQIREKLQVLMYLVDLENLHIQHTEQSFSDCNKDGLVKGIWQNHSHKKTAVQLVTNLCLDYAIYDVQLWNSILHKLLAFGLVKKLENVLTRASGVADLWHIPALPKIWQELLSGILNKGVAPLSADEIKDCTHSLNLLLRCPMPEELDLTAMSTQYCKLEMYACALACLTFITDTTQQFEQVKMVMRVGVSSVLDSLLLAQSQGLAAALVSQVERILFQYTELTHSYGDIATTAWVQHFINYLISRNQIRGLIKFLVDNNRVEQASKVASLYFRQCTDISNTMRMACEGKADKAKLQIYMRSEGID